MRHIPLSGEIEEIFQDQVAMLGRDAFGMKLHAVNRELFGRNAHHQPIVGLRRNGKRFGHAGALDHERMIAGGLERAIDAAKHARAFMANF